MRYVVFVKEADSTNDAGELIEYAPWLGIVEADNEMAAVYQCPRYQHMWKPEYFFAKLKSPEAIKSAWGDIVCVKELDELLGVLLST